MFAISYDVLNWLVEDRVIPYRKLTAGMVWGNVLEVGGGTGANLEYFPKNTQLTMLEPDKHMVRRLKATISNSQRHADIIMQTGECLPFANESFDSVLTTLTLCMVKDPDKVISEIRRVLRPGGSFFFYEHIVSPRSKGEWWQNKLNPLWKLLTTGCNLNRDLTSSIKVSGFKDYEYKTFDLSVRLPVTIPNIVGEAKK